MFHACILYKVLGSIWLKSFKIVSPIYEYKNLNIKKNSLNEKNTNIIFMTWQVFDD